jgi:hypothetical protein
VQTGFSMKWDTHSATFEVRRFVMMAYFTAGVLYIETVLCKVLCYASFP